MRERSPALFQKNTGSEGIFPCHSNTGSGRPGACVKGGVRCLPPPMEGGGFGPAGRKVVGDWLETPCMSGHSGSVSPAVIAERYSPALITFSRSRPARFSMPVQFGHMEQEKNTSAFFDRTHGTSRPVGKRIPDHFPEKICLWRKRCRFRRPIIHNIMFRVSRRNLYTG